MVFNKVVIASLNFTQSLSTFSETAFSKLCHSRNIYSIISDGILRDVIVEDLLWGLFLKDTGKSSAGIQKGTMLKILSNS